MAKGLDHVRRKIPALGVSQELIDELERLVLDLIRFGEQVNYVDLVSSSFVEESLQALGGGRISVRRSLVAAGERPVAI